MTGVQTCALPIWVALLISYLANIWSRVRHVCSNYFDFRKIKPRLESIEDADASMTIYSKASENCYKDQSIAEWGDVKSEPFGYLTPKPFSQHDRLATKKCTFSLSMCDRIFYILLKTDYIMILDHHVEPPMQGRIYCKLHDSFEHSIDNCNMFHQIVQSAIDKGRLDFGEIHIDDQSISIGLDGKVILHRPPQADSFEDEQVHTEDDGIESSKKQIIHGHVEDILEGESSIKASPRISSTGGQQQYSEIDA